jgi:hypothetical protein
MPGWVRERYRLIDGHRYLVYVGSEDPSKNLSTLVHTLARVRSELPDLELIKTGRSRLPTERQGLVRLRRNSGSLERFIF